MIWYDADDLTVIISCSCLDTITLNANFVAGLPLTDWFSMNWKHNILDFTNTYNKDK